jgi:kynurenine 3-monooxygenase
MALMCAATADRADTQTGQIAIVGAGLAGSLLAILLGQRGYTVNVYERRGDPRIDHMDEGRSINLGISARGITALRAAGLWDDLQPRLVPMRGRMIHRPEGGLRFQPYGTRADEILHSVRRNELNAVLVDRAAKQPGVTFHFGTKCIGMNRDTAEVTLEDLATGNTTTVTADFVVGADGAFSEVRHQLQRGLPMDFQQDFMEWGYRELTIPANPDGSPRTPIEALHIWPSDRGLIVGHPNVANSITCTVLLPLRDDPNRPELRSFDSLNTEAEVREFFGQTFPDTLELIPDLVEQYFAHPTSYLVTIRTRPWHYRDRVVLIGDACHGIFPFYGQGMNAAFEDTVVLDECLAAHPHDREAAFAAFEQRRKPHTDVIADLAADNFIELRDRVRSPMHLLRAHTDLVLHRLLGDLWQPLYRMISHTTIPYGDAVRRARRQNQLLGIAAGVATAGVVGAAAAVTRRLLRRRR